VTAGGIAWKWRRLRTMGVAEIAWRVQQAAAARSESAGWGRIDARPPAATSASPATRWLAVPEPRAAGLEAVLAAAGRTLAGRFDVFALEGADLGFPPRWNRCPRTGVEAPLAFGKTLNYRDPRLVGDIKYLWEPSRHAELTTLAQAHVLTAEARFAEGCRALLESWFEQCPYPLGVHWTSSLEHAVRLLQWCAAWPWLEHHGWLGSAPQRAFRARWAGELYRQQAFIAGHFSRHSSANNHLFGEALGLFVASTLFPWWGRSAGWAQAARAILEREALLQNAPDGVNREQGIWYHHEVADMMLLAIVAARAGGRPMSAAFDARLEAMLGFVESALDSEGRVPMIGDADDAVMLRLDPSPGFAPWRPLLAAGAVLFRRPAWARRAVHFDAKTRWLLGDEAATGFEALHAAPDDRAPRQAFPEGGYWLLGERFGEPEELRLMADAGPLGYLSIAAHGHADALSFTLGCRGEEVLVDPGTFAYHTQAAWRDYFKGTAAHNTLRVDGQDQSVSGGAFMWLRHAAAALIAFEPGEAEDRFEGTHDGYRRLPDPCTHRREVLVQKRVAAAIAVVQVTDTLEAAAEHEVELHWHLPEHAQVCIRDGRAFAEIGTLRVEFACSGAALQVEAVRGREQPPLGWISRRFDRRQPSPTLRWHGRAAPGARLVTHITLREAGPRAAQDSSMFGGSR
jgi:hypothetical protein